MSVVAVPIRPSHADLRHREVRPLTPVPADAGRGTSAPTVTVTVDVSPGPLSPGVLRLLDLLGELAETGEGRLRSIDGPVPPRVPAHPFGPGAVTIQAGTRVVRQDDRAVGLTRIEYDLLLFLAERPHRVFTRLQLLTAVWGYEHAVLRTVDVHVRRLRAKLGADRPVVTTVYGVGYRLADEARIAIDRSH